MTAATRTMDQKLARIRAGAYKPTDFIIADAKDGDMSLGTSTAGPKLDERNQPTDRMRPIADYRADMRRIVSSGLVDIMLTSISSAEVLAAEGVFAGSPVTPAVRLNDATDIWSARGSSYRGEQARPFRTARLDRARALADLGLYAITFYNDVDRDVETLAAYAAVPRRGRARRDAALPGGVQSGLRGEDRRGFRPLPERRHIAVPRRRGERRIGRSS